MAEIAIQGREAWRRAFLGPLPNDFLRLSNAQEAADCQAAMAIYQAQQQQNVQFMAPNVVGRLSITVSQAKLVRNYGITRMDPYARVRVGHFVYETHTSVNGGKNPHWNRVIQSQLPTGVNSLSIEIYDECSFKVDELIAWTTIPIPESVLRGETHEHWYTLSGKQGDDLEGSINVVLSFGTHTLPAATYVPYPVTGATFIPSQSGRPVPVFVAPQVPVVPAVTAQVPVLSEEDMKLVQEMFPNIDKEVIKSVFEANRNNKDATINSLLQMND
ncbi:TOLLIP family protein [Megaselia abdita]